MVPRAHAGHPVNGDCIRCGDIVRGVFVFRNAVHESEHPDTERAADDCPHCDRDEHAGNAYTEPDYFTNKHKSAPN